jgi:hypothetical protein
VDEAPDTDDESAPPPPRPFPLVVAAFATCGLGMLEARHAEGLLALAREPVAPRVEEFKMAYVQAYWTVAQTHLRGMGALEVARLVVASLLFVAAARVLVQVRDSGWLWRQALVGNVAVTFAAAWYERSLRADWLAAYERALRSATVAIAPPQKGIPMADAVQLQLTASVAVTGLLGVLFLVALAFSMRSQTRAVTG